MERVFVAKDYDGSAHFEIPFRFTTIGSRAFSRVSRSSLQSVTIPTSVTTIREYAFADCQALVDVNIPNSVTTIGARAFSSCQALVNVVIPDSVITIGASAFEGCCHEVEQPRSESERYIDEDDRVYAGLESVVIPKSVTKIGVQAFAFCRALKSIVIPGSIKKIRENTFAYCRSLESVTLGEGLESIEEHAFGSCRSLKAINIPEGVTEIGDSAFYGCELLEGFIFPSSLVTIGVDSFFDCNSLKTLVFMQRYADLETDGAYSEDIYYDSNSDSDYIASISNNIQRWERVIFPKHYNDKIERVYVHPRDWIAFHNFWGFAEDPSECPKLLPRPTDDFEEMKAIVARDNRLQTYIHRPTITRNLIYGPVPAFTEAQKRWISTFMLAVASDRLPHLPAEIKEMILGFVERHDARKVNNAITETQELFML